MAWWAMAMAAGLLRSNACTGDPCNKVNPDAGAACTEALTKLRAEAATCEAESDTLAAQGEEERIALRKAWADLTEAAEGISVEVEALESQLAAVEAENDQLHQELVSELQTLGLVQIGYAPNSTNTADQWLECMDEKGSAEIKVASCKASMEATKARHAAQNSHYESLKAAAQQNVDMISSRLSILERMLTSQNERKIRLEGQIAELKGLKVSFVASEQTVRRAPRTARQDPVAEAKEQLTQIAAEIRTLEEEVTKRAAVTERARTQMQELGKTQTSVATKFEELRAETMAAFKKAFELDYRLDQAETMHDEAYVSVKNATASYQAATEAEHAAVGELQELVSQQRRLEYMVKAEEDDSVPVGMKPDWARPKPAKARASGAPVLVLATWLFA